MGGIERVSSIVGKGLINHKVLYYSIFDDKNYYKIPNEVIALNSKNKENKYLKPKNYVKKILKNIKIPIQGGLDPKVLLTDYENLKKKTSKYLEIFKDHPYIFNLGHGILPETNPEMVENLIKIVKNS